MGKSIHSPLSFISDDEWAAFWTEMGLFGLNQTRVAEIMTTYVQGFPWGRGVVIKRLEEWLAIGGEGRTLADAKRIIIEGEGARE